MTERASHILAVDLGTGGPKVALVARDSSVVADAFEPVGLIHTDDGGIEQSPDLWWEAICTASRRMIAESKTDPAAIAAVAVTAQWATTVPVDADGNAVGNAISWLDARGGRHTRAIAGGRLRISGYGPRQLLRWIRMTGGAPSLAGHDAVGQGLFLKNERPEIYSRTAALLEPSDYLTARMTGRIVTTPETATMHWSTDTRDINDVRYDKRLLKLTGLPPETQPPLVASGSIVGDLTDVAAAELGINSVPVVAGTPDIMSAAIGSGAVADFAAHLYVGTSGWLSCHVPFKRTDLFHNIATLPSAVPGRYLICTEQQSAGGALEHVRDQLLTAGDESYEDLLATAATVPAGSRDVIFAPWINGERTPLDDDTVRGGFVNISLTTDRAVLLRATLEGIAMNVRWMHHHVERLAKRRFDRIAFIGGTASSDLWCQIIADVLDREILRVAQPRQANARGAALHAGVALGWFDWRDIPDLVQIDRTFTPDPANRETYDSLFREFKNHYRINRRFYKRLNGGIRRRRSKSSHQVPRSSP